MTEQKVGEETQNVEGKEGTSHPESVPWSQYVGLKEKFSKTETKFQEQVKSLEEQLKSAVSTDEFNKTKEELDKAKTEHQKVLGELTSIKDKSLSEKRDLLKNKGISEEEVNKMSEETLSTTLKVLEQYKPKPDFGSGSMGAGIPKGSPFELAQQAYSKHNK